MNEDCEGLDDADSLLSDAANGFGQAHGLFESTPWVLWKMPDSDVLYSIY